MTRRTLKANIKRDLFKQLKGGMSDVAFLNALINDGIVMEYQTFSSYLRNKKKWYLVDALAISKRLNIPIEELFENNKIEE